MTTIEIVREALAEDKREGSHFDADSFDSFNPEEFPWRVQEAWSIYEQIIYGGANPADFGL